MARYYSNSSSYYDYLQHLSLPIHLCFFLCVVFLVLGFTWYINYASMFEDLMDQFKLFLMVVPILLILVVHWLSTDDRQGVQFLIPLPKKESLHRAGGSPWGVAAVLGFLLYMISYQSKLQETWFPIASRR